MDVFSPADVPVMFEFGEAQVRSTEVGGMTLTFYRLPAGSDARPLLQGLQDDLCQCPHWGLVTKGRLRIHRREGPRDVVAGQAFYVEPGHAPEALEDTEMFEVSPTTESRVLGEHLRGFAQD